MIESSANPQVCDQRRRGLLKSLALGTALAVLDSRVQAAAPPRELGFVNLHTGERRLSASRTVLAKVWPNTCIGSRWRYCRFPPESAPNDFCSFHSR